jgi:iron-sulfur cluster repair protein YtfE (RIC family)
MDVIETLKADHARVIALFARLRANPPPRGWRVLEELCDRAERHVIAEEEAFYPAVHATGERELVWWIARSRAAHARTKATIDMIRRTGASGVARLLALGGELGMLERDFEQHVLEEEARWFPLAAARLRPAAREALGARFGERLRELEHGRPLAAAAS